MKGNRAAEHNGSRDPAAPTVCVHSRPVLIFASAALTLVCGATAAGISPQAATQAPAYRESISGTTVSFEMVWVPAGTISVNGATREVRSFDISRTEVTWDLYDVFALGLDAPPSQPAGADAVARPSNPYGAPDYGWGHAGFPAISVTRAAAEAFTKWLSQKTGRQYRLPTEAEWLHAAALATGPEDVPPARREALAWHSGNASGRTHAVGSKSADRLGLFDLFGNAAEWVVPDGGVLVTRGGSFRDSPARVGPAARAIQDATWNERDPQLPKSRWWLSDGPFVGFRIVSDARD